MPWLNPESAISRSPSPPGLTESRGEAGLGAAHRLRGRLACLVALAAPAYVVDLRPVSFVDSTGLNLLLRLRRRVLEGGATFSVLCAPGTRRLLRAHGTLEVFDPADTWDGATRR
ncbi:STAS domain-containing protein [Streptomyces sp. RP5T]|uniref:STAS domain-containing protein n=1 Tax=Streptomyces sp. RP5T TaxID=2490848 RepID=UPI000F653396|nr:STAS domain-containing protein [Streptomyces sp. RP5T]RRR81418.1 STAS domain-containing protein [Streptomyces sp. RP5T]